MKKIATKLTARVADFVNKHNIGVGGYMKCEHYFHYPDYFNGNHRLPQIFQGHAEVTEQDFIDTLTRELNLLKAPTEVFNPQEHYNNEYGSLYKIAEQRGWNAYMFDIIKRIDRCQKKGQFKEDLQKTKDLIDLWLKEIEETK